MPKATHKIGTAVTPTRRKGANGEPKPSELAPSSATDPARPERGRARTRAKSISESPALAATEIGSASKPSRKGRASRNSEPNGGTPSPDLLEADAKCEARPKIAPRQLPSDGQSYREHQTQPAVAKIVSDIADMQKVRRFCIKSQSRCDRSMEALIATRLGYRGKDTPEKERAPFFKLAADIRKACESAAKAVTKKFASVKRVQGRATLASKPSMHAPGPANFKASLEAATDKACMDAVDSLGPAAEPAKSVAHLVPVSASSRQVWDKQRNDIEAKMEAYAAHLPVAEWAKSIRGFGLLNLAIVCGEAGEPICDYRSVAGLWKRCGLAVINGERQRQKTGKEAGEEQKYNPKRRAEIYVVGSVSVFMAQKPGMRYRTIYDQRRERTMPYVEATADLPGKHPAKWSLKRCDNDARRIMTKALLEDLYREWRRVARDGDGVAIAAE